jgi:hypothetical protein
VPDAVLLRQGFIDKNKLRLVAEVLKVKHNFTGLREEDEGADTCDFLKKDTSSVS